MSEQNSNDPQFFEPDTRLKTKIGEILKKQPNLSQEAQKQANTLITNSAKDFTEEADFSLSLLAMMMNDRTKFSDAELFIILNETAFSIKSRAGTYGYPLASTTADMLLDYLENHKEITPKGFRVIESYVGALRAVIGNQLKGDGGKMGAELLEKLEKLSKIS